MPLENGGRSDKIGNLYEINCIIYELLKVIREDNYSVTIEALGEDEKGTDILVKKFDGRIEHQQCKARNASKIEWSFYDLQSKNIIKNWEYQLNRDENRCVAMVSHITCSYLADLHNRAVNTNDKFEDFYDNQIKESDGKFVGFYKKLCKAFGLDISIPADVRKSVGYLRRISFNQMSEYSLKEHINNMIDRYFSTPKDTTYDILVSYVVTGDILGKEITGAVLSDFLQSKDIKFRLRDNDPRVFPQIKKLNNQYRSVYRLLQGTLIERTEFAKCIEAIQNGDNLIISGKAGYGKSGCVEAVLDYCEQNTIPHLAIKLDSHIPSGSSENWGKSLGFPGSISYSLDCISKDVNAVLILDQLDALRWTASNSSEAVRVCAEIVEQIKFLNSERNKKISIVFVCRSYDLDHDTYIKSLFIKDEDSSQEKVKWEKVIVNTFDEETVKHIVGEKYDSLTTKTKRILQIPSNLYIWNHLDESEAYDDCTTSNHLIKKWFEQVRQKGVKQGINDQLLIDTKDEIVEKMDHMGRLFVPESVLKCGTVGLTHLMSEEMITQDGNKIRFVHQSLLDYFISKRMIEQYWEDVDIEQIVGEKDKQTLGKRYQVQMLLQDILETGTTDFIEAGKKVIESKGIRYNIKFIFYEMLGQLDEVSDVVEEFIIEYCKKEEYRDYLINNVIMGRKAYITLLRKKGILAQWMQVDELKYTVISLFVSISENLDDEDVAFLESYSFKNEEDDESIARCFLQDIESDSDLLFELRMKFSKAYPEWSICCFDVEKCFASCYKRIIEIVVFWLSEESGGKKKDIYRYADLFDNNDKFSLVDPEYILEKLLPVIPKDSRQIGYSSNWRAHNSYEKNLERFTVALIKKATEEIIEKDCNLFWQYYEPYLGMNYPVFNELILHGLKCLPESNSDQVILYLCQDIYHNCIESTSNAKNQLDMAKSVIAHHSKYCSEDVLTELENYIVKCIAPDAVERYKRRIEFNREKAYAPVYRSFWGDLQYVLLQGISYERLSDRSKQLLAVLERKFNGKTDRYSNSWGHFGNVVSPIGGKRISHKQWLKILTNKKLRDRDRNNWKETAGGFIESSIEMYAGDFQLEVKRNPAVMIRMVLDNKDKILPQYIEPLFSGAAFSDEIDTISKELWEELFETFPCDLQSHRTYYFCSILEKTKIYDWSQFVIDQLINVALNYQDRDFETDEQSERLLDNALNSIRGEAARAIGNILWNKEDAFSIFKDTIDKMCSDESPVIRMASLFALWPVYNIDREWASEHIISLYESDVRIIAFNDSKDMLVGLYERYNDRVIQVVLDGFNSSNERTAEISSYALCELHILNGEFSDIIQKAEEMTSEQVKSILHMAVIYLGVEDYREKAKEIILRFKDVSEDVEIPLSRMFFNKVVDFERDLDFMVELMNSNVSEKIVRYFVKYLEESVVSYKSYERVIFGLCEGILSLEPDKKSRSRRIDDQISKLILCLYDECAGSDNSGDKTITAKCLDLWDLMFEKQIGQTRWLSKELMDR